MSAKFLPSFVLTLELLINGSHSLITQLVVNCIKILIRICIHFKACLCFLYFFVLIIFFLPYRTVLNFSVFLIFILEMRMIVQMTEKIRTIQPAEIAVIQVKINFSKECIRSALTCLFCFPTKYLYMFCLIIDMVNFCYQLSNIAFNLQNNVKVNIQQCELIFIYSYSFFMLMFFIICVIF